MKVLNSRQIVFNKKDYDDYLDPNNNSKEIAILDKFIDDLVGIYLHKKKVLNVFNRLFLTKPNRLIRITLD